MSFLKKEKNRLGERVGKLDLSYCGTKRPPPTRSNKNGVVVGALCGSVRSITQDLT